jgi:predicted MPP superfamily phosphohydrolase
VFFKIILVVLVSLASLYAIFIEPQWLDVNVQDMRSDRNLDPIRIVQLSDLHIHKIGKRETKVIDQVKALKADLLVLSGDVIDSANRLSILHAFLTELGEIPAVAVLGNWEHWAGVDIQTLFVEYQHHGVRLLINDVTSYKVRNRTIHVLGIDDYTAGQPTYDPLKFLVKEDVSLLVQHSPGYFEILPSNFNLRLIDLCLAGHTHGGQVTVFGRPIWLPPGSGSYPYGIYDTTTCPLYVSRGIGTSILPIRFWARPEIAVFDL